MVGDFAGNFYARAVLALESKPFTPRMEEVLEWKIERSFGAPLLNCVVSREQLAPDSQSSRVNCHRVGFRCWPNMKQFFAALGWQAGLIPAASRGEEQWLRNGQPAMACC